jgi:RNA polymerase sigma factor (sigma-70 family)
MKPHDAQESPVVEIANFLSVVEEVADLTITDNQVETRLGRMKDDPAAAQQRALELREAHYVELVAYAVWQGCTQVEARQVANDSLAQLAIREFNPDAKPVENPRAWLYWVARHKVLELFRDRRGRLPLSELPEEQFVDPGLRPEEHFEWMEVLDAIQKLPYKHRLLLVLSARGDSIADMAKLLDCSIDAAKQQLNRARRALRAKLAMDTAPSTVNSTNMRATMTVSGHGPMEDDDYFDNQLNAINKRLVEMFVADVGNPVQVARFLDLVDR